MVTKGTPAFDGAEETLLFLPEDSCCLDVQGICIVASGMQLHSTRLPGLAVRLPSVCARGGWGPIFLSSERVCRFFGNTTAQHAATLSEIPTQLREGEFASEVLSPSRDGARYLGSTFAGAPSAYSHQQYKSCSASLTPEGLFKRSCRAMKCALGLT